MLMTENVAGGLEDMIGGAVSWERGRAIPIPAGTDKVDILHRIDSRFDVLEGPSFEVALSRAVRGVCDKTRVSRTLKGGKQSGVGVLPISVTDTAIRADGKSISFHCGPRGIYSEPAGHDLLPKVQEGYDKALSEIGADDIASALGGFIREAGGFPLNSGGGYYFLNPRDCGIWKEARKALIDHHWGLHVLPVVKDQDAMASVVEYATKHMVAEIAKINDELHGESRLKVQSAITARRMELQDLKKRATKYETMLGASFAQVKEAADAAGTAAGAAAILAGML